MTTFALSPTAVAMQQPATEPYVKDPVLLKKAAKASFIGNFVEWFDYASYGYFATVIASVFFAKTDATVALMSTYAIFALSFIVRPFGGIFWGHIGDKYGRKTMLIIASVLFIALTVPLFHMLSLGGFLTIVLIQLLFSLLLSVNDGTLPAFLSEIFPVEVRYSGFAFTFNSANALLGGTTPLMATWLMSKTGSQIAPAWLLVIASVIALVATVMYKKSDSVSMLEKG